MNKIKQWPKTILLMLWFAPLDIFQIGVESIFKPLNNVLHMFCNSTAIRVHKNCNPIELSKY